MNRNLFAACTLALALGAGGIASAQQMPTTQAMPGATPRDNSGAGSSSVDTPIMNNPATSRPGFGSTPRDTSSAGSSRVNTPVMNRTGTSYATPGATPRDVSGAGSSAVEGGPGTGPAHLRNRARTPRNSADNGAYLGGGGVYERAPDGSLRLAQ
ncbi:hypothetical protein MVG78_11905 [Roseomonas gilardii subsp. gilardii]|uniref:hypothetical protein n=1 Tax=Roseomonas gilardii TaxID=257708 RepID=UPI001FF98C31|nr:hypothetical protein [Roseomonas gilardii]UPG71293.1 hypothetical protein MVG78_11905 [Roseomonas gilardii subsp. gilardii]